MRPTPETDAIVRELHGSDKYAFLEFTRELERERDTAYEMIESLRAKNTKLRAALVGIVGVDTKEELDAMEAAVRMTPAPEEDRASTINAIHALRDTL